MTIQTRRLGRTEHQSSVAILGGAAFWASNPDEARPAFTAALQAGVNHLDIAPQYGEAERALGPLVAEVRDRLFVGCKTLRHNADGVRAQLENSLSLLGCESFDLYQMHGVCDVEELDARADAAAAILQARDEGLCRFVGVTGHDVTVAASHLEALRRYDLDTVMLPINRRFWAEPDYRRDLDALLEVCLDRDVGVMAIKAAARRPWESADGRHATTWYEPYTADSDLEASVNFTLSVPGVHGFCTPGDLQLLPRAIAAAVAYEPVPLDDLEPAAVAVAGEPIIRRPR